MPIKENPRIQKFKLLLEQARVIHLTKASELLNVSEMTIRRDIRSNPEIFTLLGGNIVLTHSSKNDYFISEQKSKHIKEKLYIGQLAAELIEEDDTVFFDCGTTTPLIASQVSDTLKFTAICCSTNAFLALQDKPNCRLILCGGSYSRDNDFIEPITLQNELDLFCLNKAFISAAGVHDSLDVTCFSIQEAKIKMLVMQKTQQSILVFDNSKIEKIHSAYIADLNAFDLILSNQQLPDTFPDSIKEKEYISF